jgi:septum formation protein
MSVPAFQTIILGSGSPRRKQLLEGLGWPVEVRKPDVEELFPLHLKRGDIPMHLAELKAMAFDGMLKEDELLITADTIVWLEEAVLGKPIDALDAVQMLERLQGKTHQVYTGVCLTHDGQRHCFQTCTHVTFQTLRRSDIEMYVQHYQPFDKAGSYGAQEGLPPGFNPLSPYEHEFLVKIGKPHLFEESLAVDPSRQVPIIATINGSYFNVMGLPIAELWDELHLFSKSDR